MDSFNQKRSRTQEAKLRRAVWGQHETSDSGVGGGGESMPVVQKSVRKKERSIRLFGPRGGCERKVAKIVGKLGGERTPCNAESAAKKKIELAVFFGGAQSARHSQGR